MESNSTLVKIESPQIQTSLLSTGWNLPAQITEDDWKQAGSFLMQVNQARQWWLGDWWNACKWGDGKAACEEVGVNHNLAEKCGVVAKNFKSFRRRKDLTFTHHQDVCTVDNTTIQDQLLDWCLTGSKRKSVRELREKVQEYLEKKDWEDFDAEILLDNDQAKKLTKAHKDLADLQAKLDQKITPSLDNLIPQLKSLLDKEDITKRVALTYSQLSEEEQKTAFITEDTKLFLLRELNRLEREKATMAESATKAHEKADAMQTSFDDAVGKSTQEILSAKDKEIEIAKKELAQAKIEAREQLEESIRSAVDREYQDEIIKATKEKEKAEKAKKDAQDKASAAYVAQGDLEHEVKKLKEQLEMDNPTNVDLAMEKQIQSVANSVSFVLKRLRQDMLTIGGGMERSIMAMEEIKKEISQKLTELLGDSEQIITISGE